GASSSRRPVDRRAPTTRTRRRSDSLIGRTGCVSCRVCLRSAGAKGVHRTPFPLVSSTRHLTQPVRPEMTDRGTIPGMHPIYLDWNATTPLRPEAEEAMRAVPFGNPSSAHHAGRAARRFLEDARELVAALLGAAPDEVIFTSGATEANNLALMGLSGEPGH